jgi:hypothetical protein
MDFIANLLKVTNNLKVIFCCELNYTSVKYFNKLIDLLDGEIVKERIDQIVLKNGGIIQTFSANEQDMCGVRCDIAITDINPKSEFFREFIISRLAPRLTCNVESKLNKFVFNPVTKEILTF